MHVGPRDSGKVLSDSNWLYVCDNDIWEWCCVMYCSSTWPVSGRPHAMSVNPVCAYHALSGVCCSQKRRRLHSALRFVTRAPLAFTRH